MTDWPDVGHMDTPAHGDVLGGRFAWIRGWAAPVGDTLDRVVIRVNGRRAGLARLGCPRPDLAAITEHPFAPICGFEFLLDLSILHDGQVRISAEAQDSGGARTLPGTATVTLAVTLEPALTLPKRPRPRSGPRDRSPRVLAVAHDLGLGGAQTFLTDLLVHLRSRGFDCRVVAFSDGVHRDRLESGGVRVTLVPRPPIDNADAYEAALSADILDGANVVLANTLASFPVADVASRHAIPVVWAIHEPMGMRAFWEVGFGSALDPAVQALAEDSLRHAARVVFPSRQLTSRFLGEIDPRRVLVIPFGLDVDDHPVPVKNMHERARAERSIPSSAVVLLCLGTIELRKGQGILATAFGRIADSHREAFLIFVGGRPDAVFEKGIRDHVDRLGLADRIRMEPATDDPHGWFAASDAVVCASDHEVLPMSLLEGMARGRAVISTSVLGVDDLVLPGDTGELCAPCDMEAMTAALDRLLGAGKIPAMGAAARQRVQERFPLSSFVGAYTETLIAVAGG